MRLIDLMGQGRRKNAEVRAVNLTIRRRLCQTLKRYTVACTPAQRCKGSTLNARMRVLHARSKDRQHHPVPKVSQTVNSTRPNPWPNIF